MKISIHGDKAEIIEGKDDIINSGGIDYYEVEVEFDETWNDLTKYAILVKKGDEITTRINIIDNKFYINAKNYGMHYIGFLGFKLNEKGEKIYQIPTNLVSKRLAQSAGSFDEEESDVPSASEWELYINQIQTMVDNIHQVPSGGTTGQVLKKKSDEDFDVDWENEEEITINHNELNNLDYEHSGHTGFQKEIPDLDEIRSGAEAGLTAVQDDNYVHTDNNYTTEEKEKLEGLNNYDDTALSGRVTNAEENINAKENIFKYSTIPENPNYGDLIQYIGEDSEKFKYGHFYKYIEGFPAQVKVEKHSETITDISVDVNIFKESYPEAKKYTFVYNLDDMLEDYIWVLSDTRAAVSFLTSGITITGTPTENDSFDVYYSYGTEEDWHEVEVETGTQFATMPTPTKALQDKIIQYVGENYKTTTIDEFENEIETVIKTGSFWKCVFDKANCTYEKDTTVNSETSGIYYVKRMLRYMPKKLPEQYNRLTTYYKRVSEELIFKWEEVEMGKTTQYSSVGSADDFPLGTIIQYVGEGENYYKGTFLENVLIPAKYSVAEVTAETTGTYYTYDDMRDRYIEVTLPDEYREGETYYEKSSDAYRDWKTLQVSRAKFKSFNTDFSKYEFEDISEMGSEPEYNLKIYDEDITYFSNVEIINIDSPIVIWLSNHLTDKSIVSNEGYFNIKVNTNDFSDISNASIYFNYLINEVDTGGILL